MVKFPLFLILFVIANNPFASGQDTLKVHHLNEIEIEVQRKLQERNLSPVQIIDSSLLEQISADNVAEALRVSSGVILKDYGGIGGLKTISIRSLGAEHTMVQIDGIAVSNTQTGQVDLGKLPLNNVEEIEVYKGQSSELLQTARSFASASLINIKTKSANSSFEKPFQLASSLEIGSFGLFRPAFAVTKRVNKNSLLSFNTEFVSASGQYSYNNSEDQTAIRNNADLRSEKLELDYSYRFSSNSKLNVKGYYFDSERGLPGAVILYNTLSAQRLWNKNYFLQANYNAHFSDKWLFMVNAKYVGNSLRYLDSNVLTISGLQDDRFYQNEYYVSAAGAFNPNEKFSIAASSDLFRNDLRANLPLFAYPTRLSWLSALAFKYHLKKIMFEGNVLSTVIDEKVDFGTSTKRVKILTPYLAMGLKPFYKSNLRFRIYAKRNFRMPNFNELYYYRVGNPNLKPEFANQYNWGLYYAKKDWLLFDAITFNMDVFKSLVIDKIIAIPTQNLFIWSIQNIGKVNTTGAEANVNLKLKVLGKYKLTAYWTYTIQQALDKTDISSPTFNHQIAYTPYETLSSGFSLQREQFTLNWNMLYSGFRYILGENIYANLLPNWSTQDLSVDYGFKFKKSTISLKAVINNVFDSRYVVINSFPMPGRNFRLSIAFKY